MTGVRGEDILEQDGNVRHEIPDDWTEGHVAVRLIDAYETLRRTPRVGPKEYGSIWPAWIQEKQDIAGWADKHRDGVWETMVEAADRPPEIVFSMMEEALCWPSRYLADEALCSNSVMLWALCRARGIEPDDEIRANYRRAQERATREARDAHARLAGARDALWWECWRWGRKEYLKRAISRSPEPERQRRIEFLQQQILERYQKREKPLSVKPDFTKAADGKPISNRAFRFAARRGLTIIAQRLRADAVPVR